MVNLDIKLKESLQYFKYIIYYIVHTLTLLYILWCNHIIMIMKLIDTARFWNCVLCEVTGINERYTHQEWIEHIRAAHPAMRLCKGCEELLTKFEYEQGKGWCNLCVDLCYDCMDTENYPEEI